MAHVRRLDRNKHTHRLLDEDRYPADEVSSSPVTTGDIVHIPPRPPRSVLPGCKAPAINRDLKPGRLPKSYSGCKAPAINRDLKPGRLPKSYSDDKLDFVGSTDKDFIVQQRPVRSLPRDQLSLPPLQGQTSTNQPNQIDQFNVSPPSRPAPVSPQIRTNNNSHTLTESSPFKRENARNRQSSISQSSQRFSLDLDSQDLDSDCETEISSSDFHLKKQQHHEWPQTKGDTNHSTYTNHSKPAQGLAEQNWYVGAFSRVEAEHALHLFNQEGAFLVRDCSKNTTYEPFVLAVFYDKRVFNIQIRLSEETSKYTLGSGLRTNDRFDSVTDIIKFHSIFPIILIDRRKTSTVAATERRQCVLLHPITKQEMIQLLN
ncbi:cytokine-dependent hematopoietic cell linker [Myxocyprinus asiaticus]|uniref:cytokine-dependent hematopoietic cell linker n=1 Tax=Myxocyprinus asiaticus TaxID=70543 RepID=UPI002223A43E|nr:cytokine-dependent hematopoietic cell linker [Myxocyprinus asiaticus]